MDKIKFPIKFTIPLRPITKKNSQQIMINPKTKRPFVMASKQYKEFEKKCMSFVKPELKGLKINTPVNVQCMFFVDRRAKCDLTNYLSSMADVLVVLGVVEDDNRDIVAGHDGSRVFYDKERPRIEVIIDRMNFYDQWKSV